MHCVDFGLKCVANAVHVVSKVLSAEQDIAQRSQISSRCISRDVDLSPQLRHWPIGRRCDSVDPECSVDVSA